MHGAPIFFLGLAVGALGTVLADRPAAPTCAPPPPAYAVRWASTATLPCGVTVSTATATTLCNPEHP